MIRDILLKLDGMTGLEVGIVIVVLACGFIMVFGTYDKNKGDGY